MSTRSSNLPPPKAGVPPAKEGLRETIDSIVVAFILAFVFRAFIIEAFVIPTGSMAATLNGAHGTMICQNCGWQFAYGLTDPSNPRRGSAEISDQSVATCPNCRFGNHTSEINDARRNPESGDRILVLKWPFDVGGPNLGPKRWDVVVFKDPSDGTTNYIKRLAGLPNEILEIIDGDVYAVPVSEVSTPTLDAIDATRHVKYLRGVASDLEGRRIRLEDLPPVIRAEATHENILRQERHMERLVLDALAELNGKLRIQRKTEQAQDALWKVVYDHDFPPGSLGLTPPGWFADEPSGPWEIGDRYLRFEGLDADPSAVRLAATIDSFCAYNVVPSSALARIAKEIPVSDVRTRFVLHYRGGTGTLRIVHTKRQDVFIGELEVDGGCRILRTVSDSDEPADVLCSAEVAPLSVGERRTIAFDVLDYRASLWIDGKAVLSSSDEQYSPDLAALRRGRTPPTIPPSIWAERLDIELTHLVVECDDYYTSVFPRNACPLGYKAWGTQDNPILLRDGEYFMLGDNSAQSKDSRLWDRVGSHLLRRGEDYQLGTVPEDQLIGRAFFVYWPSGLRTSLIPFFRNTGWIPNFGRMRWIW